MLIAQSTAICRPAIAVAFTSFTALSASAFRVYAANANPFGLPWKSFGIVSSHTNPAALIAARISASAALKETFRTMTRQLFGLAPSPPSARAHSISTPSSTAPPAPAFRAPFIFCALRFPTPGIAR